MEFMLGIIADPASITIPALIVQFQDDRPAEPVALPCVDDLDALDRLEIERCGRHRLTPLLDADAIMISAAPVGYRNIVRALIFPSRMDWPTCRKRNGRKKDDEFERLHQDMTLEQI